MAETAQGTDMRMGVALLFGFVAIGAAFAMGATAYLAEAEANETMQILSGVSLAATVVAGALVIAAIHIFD